MLGITVDKSSKLQIPSDEGEKSSSNTGAYCRTHHIYPERRASSCTKLSPLADRREQVGSIYRGVLRVKPTLQLPRVVMVVNQDHLFEHWI